MEKLELKHLAPYLPYGVEVKTPDTIGEIVSIIGTDPFLEVKDYTALDDVLIRVASNNFSDFSTWGRSQIKPILRPLSDLIKEIEYKGEKFCPYERFTDDVDNINDDTLYEFQAADGSFNVGDCKNLPMYAFNWLLSLHFDVFGLIDKGLAIDINTIKKG